MNTISGTKFFFNFNSWNDLSFTSKGKDGYAALTGSEPIGLYSLTKFSTERVVARLAELWGFDALSVRLSSVFGPWERKTSERDTPSPLFQIARLATRGEAARLLLYLFERDWGVQLLRGG